MVAVFDRFLSESSMNLTTETDSKIILNRNEKHEEVLWSSGTSHTEPTDTDSDTSSTDNEDDSFNSGEEIYPLRRESMGNSTITSFYSAHSGNTRRGSIASRRGSTDSQCSLSFSIDGDLTFKYGYETCEPDVSMRNSMIRQNSFDYVPTQPFRKLSNDNRSHPYQHEDQIPMKPFRKPSNDRRPMLGMMPPNGMEPTQPMRKASNGDSGKIAYYTAAPDHQRGFIQSMIKPREYYNYSNDDEANDQNTTISLQAMIDAAQGVHMEKGCYRDDDESVVSSSSRRGSLVTTSSSRRGSLLGMMMHGGGDDVSTITLNSATTSRRGSFVSSVTTPSRRRSIVATTTPNDDVSAITGTSSSTGRRVSLIATIDDVWTVTSATKGRRGSLVSAATAESHQRNSFVTMVPCDDVSTITSASRRVSIAGAMPIPPLEGPSSTTTTPRRRSSIVATTATTVSSTSMKPYNANEILGPTRRRGSIVVASAGVVAATSSNPPPSKGNATSTDNSRSGRRESIATTSGQCEPRHHYKTPRRSSLSTSLKVLQNPQRWSPNDSVSDIKMYDYQEAIPDSAARSNASAVDAAAAKDDDDNIYGYGVAMPDCEANQDDDDRAKYGYEEASPKASKVGNSKFVGKKYARRASIGGFPFGQQAYEPRHHHTAPRRSSMSTSVTQQNSQRWNPNRRTAAPSIGYGGEIEVTLPNKDKVVRRRSVTFNAEIETRDVTPVKELSESPEELWFQKHEFKEIRRKRHEIAARHKKDGSTRLCTRGLEDLLKRQQDEGGNGNDSRSCGSETITSLKSVLKEQVFQRNQGYFDEEYVAKMYSYATESAVAEASERALKDFDDVQKYLATTRRACRRLSC